MTKAAVFLYILSLFGCGSNAQHRVDSSNSANMSKIYNSEIMQESRSDCSLDLKSIRGFYAKVPDDFRNVDADNQFIARLQACPREPVIARLAELLNSNQRDYEVQTKITYLSIKLDHDQDRNKKKLLELFGSYPYEEKGNALIEPDRVIDMVCDVVLTEDSVGFLSYVFDLKTDNAMTTMLSSTLAEVFERNPETFLRELKTKSKGKQESVYSSLCTATTKKRLLAAVSKVSTSSDVHALSMDMAAIVNRSPICRES